MKAQFRDQLIPIRKAQRTTVLIDSAGRHVKTRERGGVGSALLLKLAASVNPGTGSGATTPPVTAKREGGKA